MLAGRGQRFCKAYKAEGGWLSRCDVRSTMRSRVGSVLCLPRLTTGAALGFQNWRTGRRFTLTPCRACCARMGLFKDLSNRDLLTPQCLQIRANVSTGYFGNGMQRSTRGRDRWRVVKMAEWERGKTPKMAPEEHRDWKQKVRQGLEKPVFFRNTNDCANGRGAEWLGWRLSYCTDGTHG